MTSTVLDQTLGEALEQSFGRLSDQLAGLYIAVSAHRELALSPLTASATADSAGNALLVFDPVPRGEHWELRRLVVGGATWTTAAAGTAVVYGTSGQVVDDPPLGSVLDEAASLPNVAFYLGAQALLVGGERLVVAVTGGTAGQQYLAVAQIVSIPS